MVNVIDDLTGHFATTSPPSISEKSSPRPTAPGMCAHCAGAESVDREGGRSGWLSVYHYYFLIILIKYNSINAELIEMVEAAHFWIQKV